MSAHRSLRRGTVSLEYVLVASMLTAVSLGGVVLPELLGGMMGQAADHTTLDPLPDATPGTEAPEGYDPEAATSGGGGMGGFDPVDDDDPGSFDDGSDPWAGDDGGDTTTGTNNNGNGNNEDGVDVSNPGNGGGGPNGEVDPSGDVDDEIKGKR